MRILAIETSCDETSVALVEAKGGKETPCFRILKNEIASQIELHREYGGVVPGLARREHAKNLIPILLKILNTKYDMRHTKYNIRHTEYDILNTILDRYPEMLEEFKEKIIPLEKPSVDVIAVTNGPGLEPALWVGINFARALSVLWDIPIIGVDHMEGHITSVLLKKRVEISKKNLLSKISYKLQTTSYKLISFPAIALAVSGGHTQLILIKKWLDYELIGQTLDDAAGEAFDKVARVLGLPYPGGPEIQKQAKHGSPTTFNFPRPMLNSNNFNFSFSGLKTSVIYTVKKLSEKELKEKRKDLAASFQEAVIETLVIKTIKAVKEYKAKSVLLAGGVSANTALRKAFKTTFKKYVPQTKLFLPELSFTGDNAAMIAAAGYLHFVNGETSDWETIKADGNKQIVN